MVSTAGVTGAGSGRGRAIALRLARDGHAVAVNDIDKSTAEGVAAEITGAGGRAIAVPADVTDRDAVFALVDLTARELGSLDVMVANAGIAQVKTLREVTRERLHGEAEVHLYETDVVYVVEGAATLVTGGTTVDPKETEPGQIRGSAIEGGETREIWGESAAADIFC